MGYDVAKDGLGTFPVFIGGQPSIATHEGVDDFHLHQACRRDHFLEMANDTLAMIGFGMERIGIVAQAGNGDALAFQFGFDLASLCLCQPVNIDM